MYPFDRKIERWALLLGVLTLLGCGGSKYRLVDVSGTVTIDGAALADASIIFSPLESGVGPVSAAKTDENGHFSLSTIDEGKSGAVPGPHRVTITTARADGYGELAKVSRAERLRDAG